MLDEEADHRFRGTSVHTSDDKARLVIPSRFRSVIKASGVKKLMVTRRGKYLVAYTLPEWRAAEDRILAQQSKDPDTHDIIRNYFGAAEQCEPDSQWRILIPARLRSKLKIGVKQKLTLVGALNHIQIWREEDYDKQAVKYDERLSSGKLEGALGRAGL